MKKLLITSIIATHASAAFAVSDYDPARFQTQATTTTSSTSNNTTGSTAVKDSGSGSSTGTSTSSGTPVTASINPSAQTGKSSQNSGSGANAAAGAGLIAVGASLLPPPTTPQGAMLIGMGILALMQAGHDKDSAGQSANTGYASNTNGTDTGSGTTTPSSTNSADTTGSAGMIESQIKEGQAKLAAAGYSMSEKGLKTPDGSVIPASSFNSASGMAAAGMTPASIAEAQKILAQVESNTPKISSIDVGGGGGGGGGESDAGMTNDPGAGAGHANPFALGDRDKAGLVAGKTVMFDGEPIGVRGQNIFDMVHNCYQKKRAGNHFIEGESDVSVRAPASLKPTKK